MTICSFSYSVFLYSILLTPWSRVLLEKLTNLQLAKKFPTFYGTQRFITVFTRARHLSLSWARSIPFHYLTIHFNIILLSMPDFSMDYPYQIYQVLCSSSRIKSADKHTSPLHWVYFTQFDKHNMNISTWSQDVHDYSRSVSTYSFTPLSDCCGQSIGWTVLSIKPHMRHSLSNPIGQPNGKDVPRTFSRGSPDSGVQLTAIQLPCTVTATTWDLPCGTGRTEG
jgi:hypothetical protein